ncbi:MAG: tetratricopeptide repeat protein [Flavobacteriales bacterium]
MLKYIAILATILTWSLQAAAQEPIALYDNTRTYKEALDLFDHEKYVGAKEKFEQYIGLEKNPQHALRINSEYYRGVCALYLFHPDAEFLLEQFVIEHPDSPWKQRAFFELASFQYQKKSYKKALEWFERVDEKLLSRDELTELQYKRGHARFETGDVPGARQDFYEAKQQESDYKQAATYYYSHIAYEQGDMQTALEGFLELEKDEVFKPLVPYYIAQIYYKQKKYDEVLRYGPEALQQAQANNTKRVAEIARLIGDSYCIKERFAEAIPYLEQYHTATDRPDLTREDYYQLAYAYHRTSAWQKAIDNYSKIAGERDELQQRASYNLGECYLKLQQKEYARNAFEEAADMDFLKDVQEDAMFNYAKLAFELSYNPFHEAITAFEEYLERYPDSPRRDEAYEFLLNVYMKSRNYERALTSLDKIKVKDNRVKEAYQVVAYNRAVDLYQSGDMPGADKHFDMVPTYPINPTVNADAKFWKAEIKYQRKQWADAVARYTAFLAEPGAFNSEYYGLAHYGMGYAYFKMANDEDNVQTSRDIYANANTAFRKYVDGGHVKDNAKENDAYLRIGDCFFVNKNYTQAIAYYDKAADKNELGKDYAMYQKAMAYGYDGQNDKKAWVLKSLLSERPDSKFEVDAKYELAKTYLADNRLNDAKTYYTDIVNNHSTSAYAKYALVDLCRVYVKEGNNEKVKETYVSLKQKYPGDGVLKEAYAVCKQVLIDDQQFQNDAMTVGGATKDEVETDVYKNAVEYAQRGDCANGITKLTAYLQRFQPAYYATEAHFYLAQCYYEADDVDKALESYNYVVGQQGVDYSYLEVSLKNAATITYNKQNYAAAREHYNRLLNAVSKTNQLEAQIGMMRCNYLLGDMAAAKTFADMVITNTSTPLDIRYTAHLWRGRIRLDAGEWDAATADFKEVIKKDGADAAESSYGIARCLFGKGEYKKCETEVFKMVEKYSAFDEWKYKAFLLLVDAYIAMPDYFNARSTINAINENVEEQWVLDENKKKEEQLNALESGQGNGTGGTTPEIDLNPEED